MKSGPVTARSTTCGSSPRTRCESHHTPPFLMLHGIGSPAISVDPASGFGAFGNECNGLMPPRRWIITRLDLLALAVIGYPLRAPDFSDWQDAVPDCH